MFIGLVGWEVGVLEIFLKTGDKEEVWDADQSEDGQGDWLQPPTSVSVFACTW